MKNLVFSVGVVLITIFISSCCTSEKTAQRKLNRIVDCNPSLLQKDTIVFRDSVLVFDTIFIPASEVDTSFFGNTNDTVIIENDRIRIEYIKKDSLIYLRGISKVDTVFREKKIYIEKKIPVERIVIKKPTLAQELGRFGRLLGLLLLIVLGVYFTYRTIKKYYL